MNPEPKIRYKRYDEAFKRRDLRLALVPLGRFEQEIVVALGIERRVEVDEVNGFVREVVAQDVEVVAEVKLVHPRGSVGKEPRAVNAGRSRVVS